MESAHCASPHIKSFLNSNGIPNAININLIVGILIYRLYKQFKYRFAYMMPHSLTGGATFTPEEFAILIETFSRRLPLTQVHFLRQVMDMVIEERSASDDASSSSSMLPN